jgi:hypothetical protein
MQSMTTMINDGGVAHYPNVSPAFSMIVVERVFPSDEQFCSIGATVRPWYDLSKSKRSQSSFRSRVQRTDDHLTHSSVSRASCRTTTIEQFLCLTHSSTTTARYILQQPPPQPQQIDPFVSTEPSTLVTAIHL